MAASRKTPTAAERAHTGIRDGVITGAYPPGSWLSENELAADLNMSRTPVRTALTRLQDEGWVTIHPKRGALVRDFSVEEMRESADFLHALETAALRRASASRRQEMAEELDVNLTAQWEALRSGSYSEFAQLATAFHRTFVEVAGNSLMLAAYDRLRDRQNMVIAKSGERLAAQPDAVVAEHRTLLEHARDGAWEAFDMLLKAHLSLDREANGAPAPGLH